MNGRAHKRGGSTGAPSFSLLTGELEPEGAVAVPRGGSTRARGRVRVRGGGAGGSIPSRVRVRGGSGSSRGRVRVRGGSGSSRGRVRVRGGSGSSRGRVRVRGGASRGVPRGGRGRGQGVQGGRATGSDRPGPRTIEELSIYEIEELPPGQGLETPLHPFRKRQWEQCAPVPRPTPSSSPLYYVQSPEVVECESAPSISHQASSDRPRQSQDNNSFHLLCYGSEPDSDESDDGDVSVPFAFSRAQRSVWATPLDIDGADDQVADDSAPADAPADASISSGVPPSATYQPWGLYEFDWKPFPNVPIPPESRREMFSHSDVGPTAPCVDPYDIFLDIWDRQFMEYIASETNRYAQQVAASMIETNSLHPNSRINKWRDTDANELYVYFAVVIAMGVVVKSRIDEYWNATPDVFYTPGFSAHMSGHRFTLISKCLHFVNNEIMCTLKLNTSEAKLFKVQPLLSHLNNKFQSMYRLGQNIALDESLLQWKGWLDINQLIPHKAATMGIKSYEICESQTGYLWRFEIHTISGWQRSSTQEFEDPMKAPTSAIVLRLTHGLEGKGHTLWMDNFYNSPCLARRLKTMGFDCVGTLRSNRKFVPQALHALTKENMRQGQITGLTSGDVDVLVWRDNNRVAMISTYHGNGVSRIREVTKPILINDYNIMMGGVDKKDQMLAMFPIERKRTKVWYKKLFRRLLNVSVLNSYIIHRQSISSSSPLTHRNFRICLVKALLSKHSSPNFSLTTTPILHQNSPHDLRLHHLAEYPFGETKVNKQRLRRKCTNKACGKLVQTYCVGCSKTMCMEPCFLALHQ